MDTQPTQLDPQVVNLAKAIRQTESGGNFTVKGKSGEYGAYQYTEPTWAADSKKYGINVSLKDATPAQQNEVAYKKLSDLKSQGYNVGQIASIWNSGKSDWKGNTGTNKEGVHYDVPQYVDSVAKTYQQLKSGNQNPSITPNASTVNPQLPPSPTTPEQIPVTQSDPNQPNQNPGLIDKLGGRVGDFGTAIDNTMNGKINPASGLLQTAGAVAGGVNDIVSSGLGMVNKGLSSATGGASDKVEGVLKDGLNRIVNSGTGQKTIGLLQSLKSTHPELAGDIDALGNILGAVTLVSGAGEVADATGGVLKKAVGESVAGKVGKVGSAVKTHAKSALINHVIGNASIPLAGAAYGLYEHYKNRQ